MYMHRCKMHNQSGIAKKRINKRGMATQKGCGQTTTHSVWYVVLQVFPLTESDITGTGGEKYISKDIAR